MNIPVNPFTQESADLITLDREGQVVLLVQTHAKEIGEDQGKGINTKTLPVISSFVRNCYIDHANPVCPNSMIAYLDWIEVYRNEIAFVGEHHIYRFLGADLLCCLKTSDVLSHYDPEFGEKRIYGTYLNTLIEVWLDDLAFHWKLENPPGSPELAAHGLLQRLEGGSIQDGAEDR